MDRINMMAQRIMSTIRHIPHQIDTMRPGQKRLAHRQKTLPAAS